MNHQQSDGRQKPPQPQVDRTIVEGSEEQPRNPPGATLAGSTKISLTSPGVATAYGKRRPDDGLPTGKEPVPLGSGTVVSVLGTGGMAKVYKIWNEKLEVHRAVKIIIPGNQADLMSRFETEVKITAKLHHPNIVDIYSVGDWNGLPYLEMEYIDGESLEAIIGRIERMPEAVCSATAIFVVRALEYAHSQDIMIYGKNYKGIVHRDLKPANIMISKTGQVKLMDFGIARPTETSLHTVEGSIVGTLPYLAPEQIDGTDIDYRVDIYALGTILYEMLTGTKTFPQKSITNLMKNKVTNDFRTFDDFDFRIPSGLSKISQKCLQVSRDDRYADAHALLEALEESHRDITGDSPETTIKHYVANPSAFTVSPRIKKRGGGLPSWLGPKVLVPAGAAIMLTILVLIFIMTGPKQQEKAPAPTHATLSQTPSTQPAPAAPAPQQQYAQEELKPLGTAPAALPLAQQPAPKPAPVKQSAASEKPKAPRTEEPSGIEGLKQKYKTDDLLAIGIAAVQTGKYGDAIAALEKLPENHPEQNKINLMLLESYLGLGRTKDALYIINSTPGGSAEFELLAGKTYFKLNNFQTAIDRFNTAMQKPTMIKGRKEVIDEALYNIALIRSAQYRIDASPDNRALAMQAWFSVKQSLQNNPNDSRFKRAVEELAGIR